MNVGAVLIAEIGSLITRVTLVDSVDGEYRLIGRAETFSSVEPPYRNAFFAVLEAAAQLAEATGRQLLHEGQLLMPQSDERDGVDRLLVTTSAAGTMALVITAVAQDVSARSALHASRCTYTTVLQTVTLDDAAAQPLDKVDDVSWIERQVQALLSLQPDAVLIAGGLEGGAVDAVHRLAHIVGLTALRVSVDASGQQRQNINARPVIYAGNSSARERVIEALSARAEIFVVDNVRPALEQEQLEATRTELSKLYDKYILSRLPGIGPLRRLASAAPLTVCHAESLMTRFAAERSGRRVLLLDCGASATSALLALPGRFHTAVIGDVGTSYQLTKLLTHSSIANIARWLPYPIDETDLQHRLLNRALRPQLLATDRADLHLDFAIAREALSVAYTALLDEVPHPHYDWLFACGGALARAPQAGLALLALLDAVQPRLDDEATLLDVHLDTLGLLPACGVLATLDELAAVEVFDRDVMRSQPLATVLVPGGEGRPGEKAIEVELVLPSGQTSQVTVRHGEIVRIPLASGRRAQLTLRPTPSVRIGSNEAGAELRGNPGQLQGSTLGLVIDARGRPLVLPQDERERCLKLWEWLVALGAERGANPYLEATTAPEPRAPLVATAPPATPVVPPAVRPLEVPRPTTEVVASGGGKRISLAELAAQETAANADPAPGSIESDMAKLRQSVEAPKKRGLFRRK
jgi:hypothetical protein